MRTAFLATAVLIVSLTVAQRTAADTIVLKNGRRIAALTVVDEGDKVRYQTPAGELTLPKSIIDHIEKGALLMPESSAAAAPKLTIRPPAMEVSAADSEVQNSAVHDGGIDRGYLAKLESEARSGSAVANEKAAMARHAAAQFELSRGDMEHALADERTALTYAPDHLRLLLNVAYIHLRESEFKQALPYLQRARRLAPDSPDEAKLEGWAYYGMNKLDRAVVEWTRALALRPEPEVRAALDKARRDLEEEENYKENESSHFTLRYSGGAQPSLAREILRALEMHFSAIESGLSYTPPEPIAVILYTGQTFADITRAPSWVGALNDGRIRVPVQGLNALTPELSRVLKHELTHSFIQQKTRGHAPTWIQEGLAQWMEGLRSADHAASLVGVYQANQVISLSELERPWLRLSSDTAEYAYAWALANIEYIIQTGGIVDVERLLDRLASGAPTEAAVHEVLHSDYQDLMKDTTNYLRKTYGR
jgi:tetratricopeptide (TPR) repeat protein